ncbi:ATP-binding protein [Haliovirga abyssi]|uniref:histidine kinase n=1 Tax=Haliovirga abyssi TaxID=2996794 RepID=A0AAU9DT29_9FUSO|nr:ATP-binding protein [Haliovirga abyssi]BDU50259.1 hypothetical protein HLVA_08280 [Haliovirga abyssi]
MKLYSKILLMLIILFIIPGFLIGLIYFNKTNNQYNNILVKEVINQSDEINFSIVKEYEFYKEKFQREMENMSISTVKNECDSIEKILGKGSDLKDEIIVLKDRIVFLYYINGYKLEKYITEFDYRKIFLRNSYEKYVVYSNNDLENIMLSDFYDKVSRKIYKDIGEKKYLEKVKRDNKKVIRNNILINNKNYSSVYFPLKYFGKTWGIGILYLEKKSFENFLDFFRKNAMLLAFIIIILGIIFTAFIYLIIAVPIKKIEGFTQKIIKGDINTEVKIKSNDELGSLANNINNMVKKLRDRIEAQKIIQRMISNEEIRKEYIDSIEKKNKKLKYLLEELKNTQAMLIEKGKMSTIAHISGEIAHELNSPLSTILTNAEMLKMDTDDKEILEKMEDIEIAVKTSKMIVDKFLKECKVESENYRVIKINNVFTEVLRMKSKINKDIEFGLRYIGRSTPNVYGEYGEIRSIIENLLENSIESIYKAKQTKEKIGKIKIFIIEKNEYIKIIVKDNGKGMTPEEYKEIFDLFYNIEKNESRMRLIVVKNILKHYSGEIKVKSKYDYGTMVKIKILKMKEEI